MQHKKTLILVECAVMIAAATVLSLLKIWNMPLGGSVTLLSMLPICLISVKHGLGWGMATSFVYSLIQLGFGIAEGVLGWGLSPAALIACFLFDYIIAFSVLGLAGMFRAYGRVGMSCGIAFALVLRFLSHLVSGTFIFQAWCPAEFGDNYLFYSVCYNGAYMLPEIIFTVIAAIIISRVPTVCKLVGIDTPSEKTKA